MSWCRNTYECASERLNLGRAVHSTITATVTEKRFLKRAENESETIAATVSRVDKNLKRPCFSTVKAHSLDHSFTLG